MSPSYFRKTGGAWVNLLGASVAPMPTYVGTATGGIASVTTKQFTRPVGTAVGDRLFIFWHADSQGVVPTITGWTRLSGYDAVTSSADVALFTRIATLTADDEPTVNAGTLSGAWFGGWVMTAIRGASTLSVDAAHRKFESGTTMTSRSVTTSVPNSLILHMGIVVNTVTVNAPSGTGVVDRTRSSGVNWYGAAVATQEMATPGSGSAASWTFTPNNGWLVYSVAVAG